MPVPAIESFQVDDIPIHRIALPTPFPVGPVNVYLIPYEGRLILVDTGVRSDTVRHALSQAFEQLGFTVGQLDEIHLTHHHVDHCGLTHWLCAQSRAQVFGHPDIPAYINQGQRRHAKHHAYYMRLMKRLGVPDDKAEAAMVLWRDFKSYTELFTLDVPYETGVRVSLFTPHFAPGHAATDTLLVLGDTAHALTGDHLLAEVTPNPLMRRALPGRPPVKALVEYRESLEKTRQMRLQRCYPGHGPVIDAVDTVITNIDKRHENRNQKILRLISAEGITPFQLCTLLFPRLDIANLYLGLSVSLGHLQLLETRNLLTSNETMGVLCFHKTEGV